MNKMRRRRIEEIEEKLDQLDDVLVDILDEEQEYYDNIPDNLQTSEKADESDNAIDCITAAIMDLRDVIKLLNKI